MTSRCLVTGGAGFIGAHLTRHLLDEGNLVVVLDDLSGGLSSNVDKRAELVTGSITDARIVDAIFEGPRFDVVYHLAAYAAECLSHFIKRFNYENNLGGSMNLLNAAVNHDVGHFVFTSSAAVYGSSQCPASEDARPEPEDSYGIAKFAVEQELVITEHMFDLPFTIFRPHNVYGEMQNISDRYRNVIGIFMNQILRGAPMSIFGDGEQTREFTHVSDVVPAIAAAPSIVQARNEVFNLGADEGCSINSLADMVRIAMGAPNHNIVHHPAREEVRHVVLDHEKAHQTFGIRAMTPLEEGLTAMAEWARLRGPQQTSPFSSVEIKRKLPSIWRTV